jgi:hypothetical protein
MNLFAAMAVGSGLIGFAAAHRFLRSKPLLSRVMACLVLGTLAMPSVLFAIYYLHILPERAWFYTLRSWAGSELLVFFLGAAGGALATLLPRWLLVGPLFFTLVTAALPYFKMIMTPLNLSDLHDQWAHDACLQSTASTCGPASCASILRFFGCPSSERELAEGAYSSASGTEAWYLARYMRSRGFSPEFDFRHTFTPTVPLPALVGVRLGGFGHFIAVLKISDGLVTFVDPLSGKRELELAEFMKAYSFTGFHMSVPK